jgi:hypothetical protein
MTTTDEDSINSSDGEGGKVVEEKGAPGAPGDNHNVRGFCVSRSLVVVVLLVSAAVVGSLTYTFTKGDEDDDYHRQVSVSGEGGCAELPLTYTRNSQIEHFPSLSLPQ